MVLTGELRDPTGLHDQSAQLFDPIAPAARESMITQSYVGILSISDGKWKLIIDTEGSGGFYKYSAEVETMDTLAPWRVDLSQIGQLYNLESDPYGQKNLYDQNPEVVKRLTAQNDVRQSDRRVE